MTELQRNPSNELDWLKRAHRIHKLEESILSKSYGEVPTTDPHESVVLEWLRSRVNNPDAQPTTKSKELDRLINWAKASRGTYPLMETVHSATPAIRALRELVNNTSLKENHD